eukprot:10349074-Karenia_brevis.AAC.1
MSPMRDEARGALLQNGSLDVVMRFESDDSQAHIGHDMLNSLREGGDEHSESFESHSVRSGISEEDDGNWSEAETLDIEKFNAVAALRASKSDDDEKRSAWR